MMFKKAVIVFLSCAFVLAAGKSLQNTNNDDLEYHRSEKGLGEWIVKAKDKVIGAVGDTIKEELGSIQNTLGKIGTAIGNTAEATLNTAKAGVAIATTVPKIGVNVLTKDENTTLSQAIRGPIDDTKNSISKAYNSTKQGIKDSVSAGLSVGKTTWDMTIVVPKFTGNLFNETIARIKTSLIKTYEEEKESVLTAVETVKEAGRQIKDVGGNLTVSTWELATTVPKLVREIVENGSSDEKINQIVKDRLELVDKHIQDSVSLVTVAGGKIVEAGDKVAKAGLDLGLVIPKYGLNLLDEKEQEKVKGMIKVQVDEVRKSVEEAVASIKAAAEKISEATTLATKTGLNVGLSIPQLGYELINSNNEVDKAELQRKTDMLKEEIQEALKKIQEAGKRIVTAGKSVANAGVSLGTAIPKFGLGLLSKEKEVFTDEAIEVFKKETDYLNNLLELIGESGSEIKSAGQQVANNTPTL